MNKIIEKKSLADEVADRLHKQIISKEYKVGDKLPTEPQLMKTYGVGRSTIREAIKIISNLGFLNVQQGVGTFVKSKTANEPISQRLKRADIHELDEVRQILEMKIAEKAASKRTKDDIAKINKCLLEREMAGKNGLLEECIEADINFHIAIAEASHNTILSDLYKMVAIHLKEGFTHIYRDTSCFVKSQPSHEQLLRYIVAQDKKKAFNTALKITIQD
jgi:DNA-binding FadR family transcriptional regulator